jgi:hypothetical protein
VPSLGEIWIYTIMKTGLLGSRSDSLFWWWALPVGLVVSMPCVLGRLTVCFMLLTAKL